MRLIKMEKKHEKEMLALAESEYKMEKGRCPSLVTYEFKKELEKIIASLCGSNYARVAIEDNKVVGYLGFLGPIDGFFGNVKGAFSPLGASAFGGADRSKTAIRLLQAVEKDLVAESVHSFGISHYAHDEEISKTFVLQGMGIRCSDLIRKIDGESITVHKNKGIIIEELQDAQKRLVLTQKIKLMLHLGTSPIFMPQNISEAKTWISNENIRIFGAKKDGQLIGFMAMDSSAETFVSNAKQVYNICGAYVEENERSSGIAQMLLEYIITVCKKEGIQYLGVDCETLNPNAYYFWTKYFMPYTYSFTRRIDERI